MDPFGFTHLRSRETLSVVPTIFNRKYKKCNLNISKLTKSQQLSVRYLYYPVNMPICRYQKRLILDSLYNNLLLTLPKELDTFFISAVTMLNFHRWFPVQKIVCICKNVESSLNAAKRFVEITGYSHGICVYANLKKNDRYAEWMQQNIIFATAQSIVADFTGRKELSEICLMVVEDAHRAISGSHPVSELIRNCILQKAEFRILAYTDCKLDKVGELQLIVMNLQIDLIRSLSSIREEISLTFASPKMCKLYINISDDISHIGNELLKTMEPIASLLYESGIFPTNEIKKIANFSINYLQRKIQSAQDHLTDIYCDFFELLSAYDILMCDGLTAFRNTLQEITQSKDILRKTCFLSTPLRSDNLQCHKLDMLITLLTKTSTYYRSKKSIVVLLCRDRDPAFVNSLLLSVTARLSDKESGFAFFLVKKNNHQAEISESMMKDKLCNVIIVPCGSDAIEINVGYVDSIICMDEGLCALHYTGTIRIRSEGNLSALCSSGYETNIYSFLAIEGTVDCVKMDHIKGLQLCNDVLPMLPFNVIPEIVEYWAQNVDNNDGLLTMVQRLDFQERLALNKPMNSLNLIKDNHSLLDFCVKETFLWQDRLQRFTLLGHSVSASNLTNIFGGDPKILEKQVLRLQNRLKLKWISEEESQSSKMDEANLMEVQLKHDKHSKMDCSRKSSGQKRLAKRPSKKCDSTKAQRLNRIDSASFTLLKVLKTELKADDFVDNIKEQNEYRERLEGITKIIRKLNGLVSL
ncbi:Uncharacterized protein BM_BM12172 [Brugia malayi]|uniref:Bm539, isoform d n=1 Tax=Brugia malayi TaxID=6279 RepID=A0A4E9F835_BRUMA|nr:Uncharacterized protein BM_BM12172 [Brugia malayi]VIO90091.1 Uncharacterized protein BM_BM12172 [Brugia malayi]